MFNATDLLTPSLFEQSKTSLWQYISGYYCVDESQLLEALMPLAMPSNKERTSTNKYATDLIDFVRADKKSVQMIDALLLEYSLDTREGILLMCLAEALMRIPDTKTANALIRDKLGVANWKAHLKNSQSLFVNASTWGLLLTGKIVNLNERDKGCPSTALNCLVNKLSEPVIRQAMNQVMKIMAHQFVLGRDITEALKNSQKSRENGFCYSFDMLGEAALTMADAKKYVDAYMQAIENLGKKFSVSEESSPSVSIKLSALHPRYEAANQARVMTEMFDIMLKLLIRARELNVAITIDAEEADRLETSLKLFEKLFTHAEMKGWGQFGLVVQAYSKRALPVIVWLARLAKDNETVIPMRLVKGAYWDSEIKIAQQRGLSGYPVYTRKEGTDVSYLACARLLLSEHVKGLIYPQFASHNAQTISAIYVMAKHDAFEFQRLHGMGDALYQHAKKMFPHPVRIYAPVGNHKDLLPYLVRRLLENGANSSFVHHLVDAQYPVADLIRHPVDVLMGRDTLHNINIPLPRNIFGSDRLNSRGVAINIESEWSFFERMVQPFMETRWEAGAIVNGNRLIGNEYGIQAPYDHRIDVGSLKWSTAQDVELAIHTAHVSAASWRLIPVTERGKYLLALADKLEENLGELVALCHREAGKTINDSIDEVREAVDFLRFYPLQANSIMSKTKSFRHFDHRPATLHREGCGVFSCISPWNFPLAIFIGQISAALVSGNTVVAKPAEQSSLIAFRTIELLLETGIPVGVIHLLPGDGTTVGPAITADLRIAGVAFTGSMQTAQSINQTLAARDCLPVAFIAETGGQNAMIVDSTALPEQVIRDVLHSAFASAGQRCSSLRVLYVQQNIADRIIGLIKGAMAEMSVGLPYLHSTDVGPVIDETAKCQLQSHINHLFKTARFIAQTPMGDELCVGTYIAPVAFEIDSICQLEQEHFGPILHVIRYHSDELDSVIDEINDAGFGLTLGVHSRNESTYRYIEARARVGNCYVNRDQVGAVVGVQPFGGQGLSGTGPKAGGPHYLFRFIQEHITVTDEKTHVTVTNEGASSMSLNHETIQMTEISRAASQCEMVWEEWNMLCVDGRLEVLSIWSDYVKHRGDAFQASARMIRYQLQHAREILSPVHVMPGPTGETNELYVSGRGLFLISGDETLTLVALVGQLSAALVAGNSVLIIVPNNLENQVDALISDLVKARVSRQLVQRVNEKHHDEVLTLSPLKGVAEVAQQTTLIAINRKLAAREGVLVQFVAESDGINLPLMASATYLLRFITERTKTINITAVGGNATLLELGSDEH